ncbi:hypothetical protein FSP39_015391 [Pinctada imbricata]|uniref:Uncharacterized protein n=1 Tax=Pinctada imbricata TaxID=66713 RepID=A0AA88XSE6_PINIB|nr:hypothetical protein FSP39_015391 [Pinctada imbricata]
MELCYKYRIFTAIWCSIEILLFGGIVYGWGSLVFVLKQERFYIEECSFNSNRTASSSNLTSGIDSVNNTLEPTSSKLEHYHSFLDDPESGIGCIQQEARLNVWFSIAVGIVYAVGCLCIAFATPELPWLLGPGLACVGLSGLVMLATSMQVANLFHTIKTTVVAVLSGLFDVSSMTQQLVKIAHENGASRKESYLIITLVSVFTFAVSTFLLLPKDYILGRNKKVGQQVKSYDKDIPNHELQSLKDKADIDKRPEGTSLTSCMMSVTYVSHLVWFGLNMMMFVSFIGLLNVWLERLTNYRKQEVNHYLSLFAYITISTAAMALVVGFLYDSLRKAFSGKHPPESTHKPAVIPQLICGLIAAFMFFIPLSESLDLMILVFILFTMFRSFAFSIGIGFLNEAFPPQHFGALYGVATFTNGLFSLFQYGLFEWNKSYPGALIHVNIFLGCIGLLTCIQPVILWIRSHNGHVYSQTYNEELIIQNNNCQKL